MFYFPGIRRTTVPHLLQSIVEETASTAAYARPRRKLRLQLQVLQLWHLHENTISGTLDETHKRVVFSVYDLRRKVQNRSRTENTRTEGAWVVWVDVSGQCNTGTDNCQRKATRMTGFLSSG